MFRASGRFILADCFLKFKGQWYLVSLAYFFAFYLILSSVKALYFLCIFITSSFNSIFTPIVNSMLFKTFGSDSFL